MRSNWTLMTVAPAQSHHELDGRAAYAPRFDRVEKFHHPGLAPARDNSGAFHIDANGCAAYTQRFFETFGFYGGRAAATDEKGWLHILTEGQPLYRDRYAWCGNFQEKRCTVRGVDGRYLHIDSAGRAAYPDRHLYAGDFRDGIAVVRSARDAMCRHIDPNGNQVHDASFLDLDVFHKGLARAREPSGWFHIGRDGRPAYAVRFSAVEPFYNGVSLAETLDGVRIVVGLNGETVMRVDVSEPGRLSIPWDER